MDVRAATESDAPAISGLLAELGHPLPTDDVRRRLRELQSLSSRYGTFVAVLDGQVVGVVSAFATPVLHRLQPVGRVSVLVVAAGHAGRGIGSVLLLHAESFLLAHGCSRIELTSAAHRTEAHAFYLRRGYTQQGLRFAKSRGHGARPT